MSRRDLRPRGRVAPRALFRWFVGDMEQPDPRPHIVPISRSDLLVRYDCAVIQRFTSQSMVQGIMSKPVKQSQL
jgi:hypothetical protein